VFLTGRYVATAYNTRTESEWPPHPSRLFSALVATHFSADHPTPDERSKERETLEWLEQQGPPSIVASEAAAREVVTVFVPVNDVGLTDVDAEAEHVDAVRAALSDAKASGDAKAMKQQGIAVKKAEAAYEKAVSRATAVPAKPPSARYGQRVLPEFRVRQPRTFPSVTPDDARVTYVWAGAAATDALRGPLDNLLRRVVRLGHSSSLVSLRLVDHAGPPTWRPNVNGERTMRGIESGQLASLERAFEHHRETEPRVMPAVSHSYTRQGGHPEPLASAPVFSDDWLVLRRVEGPLFPMTAAVGLARAVRKTLMSYADEPLPEILSGHTPDKRPSQEPHLAIVPLPFVGHEHASGAILGIALVLPRGTDEKSRRGVYHAVAQWEAKYRREDEETPTIQLNLGAGGELQLERVDGNSVQSTLRSRVWSQPARIWSSVTPVALDRNPGDLRSRDPRRLAEATDEARETICRACERIGVPQPKYVEILPAAPWAATAKAREYPPYPESADRTRRVLTHVRIEFDRPVGGPILLGAGRYVGLGLFRPETSQ